MLTWQRLSLYMLLIKPDMSVSVVDVERLLAHADDSFAFALGVKLFHADRTLAAMP